MASQIRTEETMSAKPYRVHARMLRLNGELTERVFTSDEIDRLTPPGKPITASCEEVLAVIFQAAKNLTHS